MGLPQSLSPISLHTDAEPRARNAAARVARGGFVAPDVISEAPLGAYADDGKESGLSTSGSPSFKLGGPPLRGRSGYRRLGPWPIRPPSLAIGMGRSGNDCYPVPGR
jgi:hypothetical protein